MVDQQNKEITELKKQVKLLQKQLAKATQVMAVMEKKLNRVYHDHHNTSAQVRTIAATINRNSRKG